MNPSRSTKTPPSVPYAPAQLPISPATKGFNWFGLAAILVVLADLPVACLARHAGWIALIGCAVAVVLGVAGFLQFGPRRRGYGLPIIGILLCIPVVGIIIGRTVVAAFRTVSAITASEAEASRHPPPAQPSRPFTREELRRQVVTVIRVRAPQEKPGQVYFLLTPQRTNVKKVVTFSGMLRILDNQKVLAEHRVTQKKGDPLNTYADVERTEPWALPNDLIGRLRTAPGYLQYEFVADDAVYDDGTKDSF